MLKQGFDESMLAEACYVSKEVVANWLKGDFLPRPNKLVLLSEVLQLPTEVLLPNAEPTQPKLPNCILVDKMVEQWVTKT